MKTRGAIQILFSALLLIVVAYSPGYSQDPIPAEKKRALHRFDPTDIFPEEREVTRTRGKKKQKNNEANSAATKLRSLETVAPARSNPVAATRRAVAAPSPSPTPPVAVQEVVAEPSVTPTPETQASPDSESKATSRQSTIAAVQANLPPGVGGENQTGNGQGLPIYFLVPILLLILFALIAFIVSLKKQLRTP